MRREAWYNEAEDLWEFRGSSFGSCMHGLVMALRGHEKGSPDLRSRVRFAAGNSSEARIKNDLVDVGAASRFAPDGPDLGVMWDAGDTYLTQRTVRGYHVFGPKMCSTTTQLYPRKPDHDAAVVQCSLDGWGIGLQEFVQRAGSVYRTVPSLMGMTGCSWVWEHKSMSPEKFASLLECTHPASTNHLDPFLFRQRFLQYAWQVQAQAGGLHELLWHEIYRHEPPANHDFLVWPRAFISVEVLHNVAGDYLPVGRHLFYLEMTSQLAGCIATRLREVLRLYRAGEVPKCDSEFRCEWPVPEPPKRTGTGPISVSKHEGGPKDAPGYPKTGLDLSLIK